MRSIVLYLIAAILTSLQGNAYQYELSALLMFQNEAEYLDEWIQYHKNLGVEHFILYNHLSTDDYLSVLAPYIQAGFVELHDWKHREYLSSQCMVYQDGIRRLKNKTKWLAVIDADEFIVPVEKRTIQEFLQEYEDDEISQVVMNWQIFGTSGINSLPKGEWITKHILHKYPTYQDGFVSQDGFSNTHVKAIIRPDRVDEDGYLSYRVDHAEYGVHIFLPLKGFTIVDPDKKIKKRALSHYPILVDKIRLHHYWFRTFDWFMKVKAPRRYYTVNEIWNADILNYVLIKANSEYDPSILSLLPTNIINTSPPYLSEYTNFINEHRSMQAKPFVLGDIMGQLGNQMFQVAATVSLALDNNATPIFPTLPTQDINNISKNYPLFFWRLNVGEPNGDIKFHYFESHLNFDPIPYHENMRLTGFFQSEKYFRHHKREIIDLFTPHTKIESYLSEKYSDILSHPKSIGIHIRTYSPSQCDPEPKPNFYHLNGADYISKALSFFPEDSLLVVFSDNIPWCKENLKSLQKDFLFIEDEEYYHDFYLMSRCKHQITSNSTFSWWAAYLNRNTEKIITAPKQWFETATGIDSSDIYPEGWIVIQ